MRLYYRWLEKSRGFDWWLFLSGLILALTGLVAIYSIDLSRGEELNFFSTQILALAIGLVGFFVISFSHLAVFRSLAKLIYLFALVLLVLVLFLGINIRGTTGWFRLAGFSFQPAELAKAGLAIFLAWWTTKQARRFDRWQYLLTSGFFAFVPCLLILFQPDLGSALILAGVWFGHLLLVGTKKRYLFSLVGIFIFVSLFSWFFLFADYQKERLMTFVDPGRDPLGAGYNVAQSMIAIGSGQLLGRGLGFGSQSQLHFLPEAQTDFIFSVIAEELGFLGAFLILGLYFLLLVRLWYIARQMNDDFSAYLVLSILLLFFLQLVVNTGGALGLLQVTGVTLPFVSYGGSSLLINFLLLGLAGSAARAAGRL